jgi:predicted metalloprotease
VVGNYVARYYHFAVEAVREVQNTLQSQFDSGVAATDKAVMALLEAGDADSQEETKHAIVKLLTKFTVKVGDETNQVWKELFPKVLTTYRDGFIIKGLDEAEIRTVSSKFSLYTSFAHTVTVNNIAYMCSYLTYSV